LEPAREFVRRAWAEAMEVHAEPPKDAKTGLQEFLLARAQPLPVYELVGRDGPPHEPLFTVRVSAGEHSATGTAGSKRVAERRAAESLLAALQG
jgi:ribonuclease-3